MAGKVVTGTIAELAKTARVNGASLSVTDWSVLTRILQDAGCARIVGDQKSESGKGRVSKVWEISAAVTFAVGQAKKVAK